ncbi:hypothetical protein D0Y65_010218 [Glycine soja]|uniref:Uncharacterized protein n=1 Tax=Glycine soja TaxID=3848 RepID=A0A445L2B0_GLYSO|nr:hypothetical protein D0Y65_010218 [Glycine soja]
MLCVEKEYLNMMQITGSIQTHLRDHDVQQGEITFQIKVYSFSLAFAVCNAFPCVSNGIAIVFGRRNFTQYFCLGCYNSFVTVY